MCSSVASYFTQGLLNLNISRDKNTRGWGGGGIFKPIFRQKKKQNNFFSIIQSDLMLKKFPPFTEFQAKEQSVYQI